MEVFIMAIRLWGGGNMNPYAPFCEKQAVYIRKCQESWLNVAEGG